jgi:hypothetical protein
VSGSSVIDRRLYAHESPASSNGPLRMDARDAEYADFVRRRTPGLLRSA